MVLLSRKDGLNSKEEARSEHGSEVLRIGDLIAIYIQSLIELFLRRRHEFQR